MINPTIALEVPEIRLLAAVIRQAKEDYIDCKMGLSHLRTRKYARRLKRRGVDAEIFLYRELEDFLKHHGIAHLIDAHSIRDAAERELIRRQRQAAGII